MKRIFLLVLVFIAFCGKAVCEDIAYVVTQDSNLRPPNSLVGSVGTVKKGDIVYFQGKIDKQVHSFDFLVRTEKGQEGCIDEKYILLRDSKSLPNAITGKTWIVSYYQQFLQGVKKEKLFDYEPFWRDVFDEIHSHLPEPPEWWEKVFPMGFDIMNKHIIGGVYQGYINFAIISQKSESNDLILDVLCIYEDIQGGHRFHDRFD